MIFLFLSILFNTLLGVIFKYYGKYKIDVFQAIVFNYIVCVIVAWLDLGFFPLKTSSIQAPWFLHAIGLGFFFVTGFNFIAQTVHHFGITTGAIMQKMSLGFTVVFSFLVLSEPMTTVKWLGVVAAIGAIIFTNYPEQKKDDSGMKWDIKLSFPLLALVFSILIEIFFLIVEKRLATKSADPVFIATLFGTAAGMGLIGLIYLVLTGKSTITGKNILAGIILGVPNYGSIYFMLKALGGDMPPSVFFTLNNVGIILLATAFAILLFKDRLRKFQYIGLGLAVGAILLMSY